MRKALYMSVFEWNKVDLFLKKHCFSYWLWILKKHSKWDGKIIKKYVI